MKALEIGAKILVWVGLWFIITLCWVGAEWLFEGVVHSSKIDCYFAGLLAFYMMRNISHIDREIARRREENAAD